MEKPWLYALQKISVKTVPVFPKENDHFDECKEFLLSSAVVNIKKSEGLSTSSTEDLNNYANEDRDLLREQISLIDPEIVLCGYTFDQFKNIWPEEKPTRVGKTEFIFKVGKYFVIDWWHPANQYPNDLCYYALCAIMQEANIL